MDREVIYGNDHYAPIPAIVARRLCNRIDTLQLEIDREKHRAASADLSVNEIYNFLFANNLYGKYIAWTVTKRMEK